MSKGLLLLFANVIVASLLSLGVANVALAQDEAEQSVPVAVEPAEEEQIPCFPCLYIPMLIQNLTRFTEPFGVALDAPIVYQDEGDIVDCVSFPGHCRVWFLRPAEVCGQTDHVRNVKYEFGGSVEPTFTYLFDAEELPDLVPLYGFLWSVEGTPEVLALRDSLRDEGYNGLAAVVQATIDNRTPVYFAQLNRSAVAGYGLFTRPFNGNRYTLVCQPK